MSVERPEIAPSGDGAKNADHATLSLWWRLLAVVLTSLPFGALDRLLHLTLVLPEDAGLIAPTLFILLITAIYMRPRTARQLGTAVTIGVAVGATAMLIHLAVILYSQNLEAVSQAAAVRLLGTILLSFLGGWIIVLLYRWLVAPLAHGIHDTDRPRAKSK